MPTTSATLPGSATSTGSGAAWSTPSNVTTDDDSWSTANLESGVNSQQLVATQFGFSIGSATINGISVQVRSRRVTVGTTDPDDMTLSVRLRNSSGTLVGSTKTISPGTTAGATTLGGSSDTWSASLTDSDINSSNFGVEINATSIGDDDVEIDYIRVTIDYTSTASAKPPGLGARFGKSGLSDNEKFGVVAIGASTTIAPTGTATASGSASGTSNTSLSATPEASASGVASGSADSSLSATANATAQGQAQNSASSNLSATANLEQNASSAIGGNTTIVADGATSASGISTGSANTYIVATGLLEGEGSATGSSSSTISATAQATASGISSGSSNSSIDATGTVGLQASTSGSSQSTIDASGSTSASGTSSGTGTSGLDATGNIGAFGSSVLTGSGSLAATGATTTFGTSGLAAQGILVANGTIVREASCLLSSSATLTANPIIPLELNGTAILGGAASLSAVGLDLCPCPPWQNEATLQNLFKSEDTLANTWKRKPCG